MDHTRLMFIGAGLLVVMIVAMINNRKRRQFEYECSTNHSRDVLSHESEVLGVKKITPDISPVQARTAPTIKVTEPTIVAPAAPTIAREPEITVMHLIADANNPYSGYELLQALQNAGLRFGEMNIFHRHEHEQGLGTVLFSVANACEPGVFDMENMGGLSTPGLTFFMQHQDSLTDEINLEIMVQTMMELVDDLGGTILDSQRKRFIPHLM